MNKEKITKLVISIWFENLLFVSFKVNKIKNHPILTTITPFKHLTFLLWKHPFEMQNVYMGNMQVDFDPLCLTGTVGHFFGPYLFLNDGCHHINTSKELRMLSLCPCVFVRETEREGKRRRETGR